MKRPATRAACCPPPKEARQPRAIKNPCRQKPLKVPGTPIPRDVHIIDLPGRNLIINSYSAISISQQLWRPESGRSQGYLVKVPQLFGEGVILEGGPSPVIRHSRGLWWHFRGEGPRPKKRPSPKRSTTFPNDGPHTPLRHQQRVFGRFCAHAPEAYLSIYQQITHLRVHLNVHPTISNSLSVSDLLVSRNRV